ncbi:hypothetical protein [Nitrosomonas sp. HPC101]
MEAWSTYLQTGGVVGFFAGLLGIGGGLVMVRYWLHFYVFGFPG